MHKTETISGDKLHQIELKFSRCRGVWTHTQTLQYSRPIPCCGITVPSHRTTVRRWQLAMHCHLRVAHPASRFWL